MLLTLIWLTVVQLVWRCTVCNRESDHLSNMRSHVELHIQINRSCDECGKTFNTKAPINYQ